MKFLKCSLPLLFLTIPLSFFQPLQAQKTDQKRNAKYSILGGPGYTPDFGVLLGGSALVSFHTTGMDSFPQRSIIPLAFAVTFGNGLGTSFTVRPQFYFNQDRLRLMGQIIYKNGGDNYYGVGYTTNRHQPRGIETTRFYMSMAQINPVLLFRMGSSHFFVGPMIDLVFDQMKKPSPGVLNDPHYQRLGGTERGFQTLNNSLGFALSYDTRDIPANAYRGVFIDLKAQYSDPAWWSDYRFGQVNFNYRQYINLGNDEKARIISWMVSSNHTIGEVPFTRMPSTGSPFDLRGYYLGQYRDKSSHIAVAEYRHKFTADTSTKLGRLLNRFGFATWAGVGLMGPNPVHIEGVLPNFGAGLRIQLQPRMNFRMDIGYSPIERQTLLYFNMTEAF